MRCFIAIDLSPVIISEIARIQKQLKHLHAFEGTYVAPEITHVTLKFLGDINPLLLGHAREQLSAIKVRAFETTLGPLGLFSPNNPRVVWISLNGGYIIELQKQIELVLQNLIAPSTQEPISHITLARIKKVLTQELAHDLQTIQVEPLTFKVESLTLKKSELITSGPLYQTIEQYALKA